MIQQFDYKYISAMRCTSERGKMTKLDNVATSHNYNFMGGGVFWKKQFAENANKSYHVCKVIVVLHIYHKMFGIR